MTELQRLQTRLAQNEEAVRRLLAAIDELNTAKPLVKQSAWKSVLTWASVLRPVTTAPENPYPGA